MVQVPHFPVDTMFHVGNTCRLIIFLIRVRLRLRRLRRLVLLLRHLMDKLMQRKRALPSDSESHATVSLEDVFPMFDNGNEKKRNGSQK